MRRLEDAAALDEKRRKQQEVRMMYDKSMRLKREKEARQLQEQLAFDMKILEQLLEESRNEAMEQQQRKVNQYGRLTLFVRNVEYLLILQLGHVMIAYSTVKQNSLIY